MGKATAQEGDYRYNCQEICLVTAKQRYCLLRCISIYLPLTGVLNLKLCSASALPLIICQGLRAPVMALTWDLHLRTVPMDPGATSKLRLRAPRPVATPCCLGLLVGFLAWVLDLHCRQPHSILSYASMADLGPMLQPCLQLCLLLS